MLKIIYLVLVLAYIFLLPGWLIAKILFHKKDNSLATCAIGTALSIVVLPIILFSIAMALNTFIQEVLVFTVTSSINLILAFILLYKTNKSV